MNRPIRLAAIVVALILTTSRSARAGMPMATLTDIAMLRLETISFFVVCFLASSGLVRKIWNAARADFPRALRFATDSLRGLDQAEIAHASVLTRTAQQLGGSFGTAVLAVILEGAVASHHGDLTAAFNLAFWWSVGFAGLAALLSLWLPGRPGPAKAPATAAPGATHGAVGTGQPVR